MDYEKELMRLQPVIDRLRRISLLGKKVVVSGEDNFVKSGPNIIVGNHVGSFKDIAVLFKITPRFLFFTANQMIFKRKDFNSLIRNYFHYNLKEFGLFLDLLLKPWKAPLVDYISRNISRIGTVPVDIYRKKKSAIGYCEDRLRENRAVVLLQGWGKIKTPSSNPYMIAFKRGPAVICYNLMQEGLEVPVTPVAMFRTHWPLFVPCTIQVKVGAPMTIKKHMSADPATTIASFRQAMEDRVRDMLLELIREKYQP
ncbi:MAG: lysophospholipid acyltransferase family protein [Candidatus Aminicenantaceae bacterium]